MKLIIVLSVTVMVQVHARTFAQKVTLSVQHAGLAEVFDHIREQTGYDFIVSQSVLDQAKPVSISVSQAPLRQVLDSVFSGQPFVYEIRDRSILVKQKKTALPPGTATFFTPPPAAHDIHVHVTDSAGSPLQGASVVVKGTKQGGQTNSDGNITLAGLNGGETLVVSFVGYETKEVNVGDDAVLTITLKVSTSQLDEMQVIAYGTTTKRLSTGDVSTVTAADIEKQPIANPLAALEGRVPGLNVIQSSGIPGAAFKVQIRGRTSINKNIGNDPLFIIDGIPFANNNDAISSIGSALNSSGNQGLSPFNLIDPSQIESISILKDADATSIYGARGANGVVLITTKRGIAGKTEMSANFYSGFSNVPEKMQMMNTQQYLAMRHEAFANDGVTPTSSNAKDLFLWDTTRYTDWQKYFIGNTAHLVDANLNFSGGSQQTQFLVGGGYHRATTVFPGDLHDGRSSLHFNITHHSNDKKFNLNFSGSFSEDVNHLNVLDLTQYTTILPPNSPPLYTPNGELNFSENGYSFTNPLSYLFQPYTAKTDNYIGSLLISYQLLKGLIIKSNFGFNGIYVDETTIRPISSQNPAFHPAGYAQFSNSNYKSLIAEPQMEYNGIIGPGKLNAIIGGTWQENTSNNMYVYGAGYTNDALLNSIDAATDILSKSNSRTQYKYAAAFGRANYNIQNSYIFNLSGRRDGSSRFGPGKQYANFWSIGVAWIFSNEKAIKEHLPFLSFGKLRGSYGTSGNDKIGDYQYLDTWEANSQTYLNNSGLYPTRLFNPDYAWEINKKMELGLELGFLKDRILLTTDYYRNRSGNQLIPYNLPVQTGGSSVTRNFPAKVQNSGWEFTLNTSNIQTGNFSWKTNINLTIPKNKLLSFPNFETSSYYGSMIIGQSIDVGSALNVKDVNPKTGVFEILDKDGNITSSPVYNDMIVGSFNNDPKLYGGIGNELSYKGVSLSLFFDFKKQTGRNYYGNFIKNSKYPGMAYNFPVNVLDRWTLDNKTSSIQKFTTTTSSDAYKAANSLRTYNSNIFNTDASYIRLKNISFSYNLPKKTVSKIKANNCKLFINIQNLFTITKYKDGDPNIQQIYSLPQLRTFVAGCSVTF